ncbi:MAG: calcium-binding protein [Cyanobacteria bacterium P01_F01_bin.143]
MSAIINPTEPFEFNNLLNGRFDIKGFENQENRLNGTSRRDSITGGNLADVLSGLESADTVSGGGGNDTLFGCDGNDSLDGGIGNDFIKGDTGNDFLKGDTGNDFLDGGSGNDSLQGNSGNDILLGGTTGSDTLEGGEGNDTLHGNLNAESINVLDDNSTVAKVPNTNINQVQTGLNEVLVAIKALLTAANDGGDSLSGGAGDDVLSVTDGNNTLSGGTGADTFQFLFSQGVPDNLNEITDFQPEEDSIVIQGTADNNEPSYDPETGRVSLDGQEIIQLEEGLNIDSNDIEFI